MSDNSIASNVWVVIPAAGIGSRMRTEIPKQYLRVHSKTILEHTINCFLELDSITGIVIVLGEGDPYWSDVALNLKKNNSFKKTPIKIAVGGVSRAETVSNGLMFLENEMNLVDDQWVMVHDAARPCLRNKDLMSLLKVRDSAYAGGILASPVKDTMKRADMSNNFISHTEPRERLWHALTPQMFRLGELSRALKSALQRKVSITDEASVMELMGASVVIIEGASDNIKLTTPSDLPLIEFLLQHKGINHCV